MYFICIFQSLSGHTTPVECVCFGHSEDLVCAGSQTGALKIWDLEAAKLLRTFTGHKGAIKCMDFHPYGDYLTTGSCDSNIKLWDTRKRGCIVTYSSHRLAVNSLQFSPDGQWIASACEDGKNFKQLCQISTNITKKLACKIPCIILFYFNNIYW